MFMAVFFPEKNRDKLSEYLEDKHFVSNLFALGQTGSNFYAMISAEIIPDGATRIPVQLGITMLKRVDTVWVKPRTASEGHNVVDDFHSQFINSVTCANPNLVTKASVSEAMGKKKVPTLIDAQKRRKIIEQRKMENIF